MKYPIDAVTAETFYGHLIAHDRAQRNMIQALTLLLQEAMNEMGMEDTEWYDEAKKVLKMQAKIKMENENRLFNAKNGHPDNSTVNVNVSQEIGAIIPNMDNINVPGASIGPEQSAKLSEMEKGFGEELSEEELARHFNDRPKSKKVNGVDMSKKEPFKGMTLDEIESWEAAQQNTNDIYKIKGRVQNLAVGISGGTLTAVGEMMVNSFVHVVKDLYDFADTIQDKSLKIELTERIRKHESMPGTLISAASSGVKVAKK
jgi:hypothetical protein